jgi:hypothetical protein
MVHAVTQFVVFDFVAVLDTMDLFRLSSEMLFSSMREQIRGDSSHSMITSFHIPSSTLFTIIQAFMLYSLELQAV